MTNYIEKVISSFPKDNFKEVKTSSPGGGCLIVKINLPPASVFELLEFIYGSYEDASSQFVYVDDKTTWERIFKTKKGVLRVYDFKGSTSIGNCGRATKALEKESKKFKVLLEKLWPKYLLAKKKNLKDEIKKDPLHNFMRTFLATHTLLNQARTSGSFLEALALLAIITDAQLRYGILLSRQIKKRTKKYDKNLVYQKGNNYISERDIQLIAHREGLLSPNQYKETSRLYSLRNRAIHRYFISDFEYIELPKILNRYEKLRFSFYKKLDRLEKKQAQEGIGIITKESFEIDANTKKRMIVEERLKINSDLPTGVVPKRKFIFPREFGPP